jgi:hypothetical protein
MDRIRAADPAEARLFGQAAFAAAAPILPFLPTVAVGRHRE